MSVYTVPLSLLQFIRHSKHAELVLCLRIFLLPALMHTLQGILQPLMLTLPVHP